MDKSAAQSLVRKTLQNSFDRDNFVYMVKNLLNRMEEAQFTYKGNLIFDDFVEFISCVERVGKYRSPDEKLIDILIVYLKKSTSLERARTKQRNFVAKYLKGSRGGVLKDAALVAFVVPNGEDWRFSLVKMDYKFNEKGKVKEEFTPARRYSFLVGKNESSHTAQSRLLPLLLDDETLPTLDELEEAFSVERVTKEFFEKYRDLFLRLKESLDAVVEKDAKIRVDFKKKNVDTADFAKKLVGQIVFLYFLQKKGWFGVKRGEAWGSGSKRFLRELFEKKHGDYKNFFNDILEPLFYEALRLERPGDYYSRFNCRIPFLNGGLFDPINDYDWWNTDILLPDGIFSNNRKTKEGDIGDGILDIFDRYNFTVKEDEPLEKEVAVDPEMLGKVFENLLEVKDRKSKGTYYTPREIVHYMCQESLASYLATELEGEVSKEDIETLIKYGETVVEHDTAYIEKTASNKKYRGKYNKAKLPESVRKHAKVIDDKLATIRVCDPAVGSGAFLVGMMNEIIRTRNALTTYIGENENRTPYHFKRHAIQNCLYGVDIDPGAVEICKLRLWLSLVVDEESRETVQPLPNLDYKIVQGNSLLGYPYKPNWTKEIESLKKKFFETTSPSEKNALKNQIDSKLKGFLANSEKSLGYKASFDFEIFFSEVFHEKGGFDIVIANPPYIQLQKAIDDSKKYADLYKNAGYGTFDRTGDIYCLFYEKGIQILKPKGILTYISSNKWMRAGYGKKIRRFFLQYNPLVLIDLGPNVFETATVDTSILVLKKEENSNQLFKGLTLHKKDHDIADALKEKGILLTELTEEAWFIGSPAEVALKKKIEEIGTPLKDWDVEINRGVLTGFNEAFIIDIAIKERLIAEDPKSAEIIKPLLRGRDIKRYGYSFAGKWLIATHNGYTDQYGNKVSPIDINEYPAVKKWLDQFYDRLEARCDKGNTPYNLRDCAYWQKFEKEKIMYPVMSSSASFFYDADGFFCNDKGFIVTGFHLKYLTAILNSIITHYYLKQTCSPLGDAAIEYRKIYLDKFPIPKITSDNKHLAANIEVLVDEILTRKKRNLNANTLDLEKQIEQLVYKLYGLTKDEIKIVEGDV